MKKNDSHCIVKGKVKHPTNMRLKFLGYSEYRCRYRLMPAVRHDIALYSYENWKPRRETLIKMLQKKLEHNPLGFGGGDFLIGEDWFGNGVLHLVLLNWKSLTIDLVSQCSSFVSKETDFLITIGLDIGLYERGKCDFLEVMLACSGAYLCFYQKSQPSARRILLEDNRYSSIRKAVSGLGAKK